MLDAVRGRDIANATDALLALTYNDPDRVWVERLLLDLLADESAEVQLRSLAVTCLGHLARIHRAVSRHSVVPVLRDLTKSPVFGGLAVDAMDDIETFTRHRDADQP